MFPTKILLATDGSRETSLAAKAAVELADSTASELHVVHVLHTVLELPYPPRSSAKEHSEALLQRRRLKALKLLDEQVRCIEEDLGGSVTESYYREGRPEKEVIRLGKELDVGLIMTGGQRRLWFERIFGAGFSQIVLRRADRPVLVVNEQGLRNSTILR
jgi:nucleotide-binding universal stress UspA family protein